MTPSEVAQLVAALTGWEPSELQRRLRRAAKHYFASGDYPIASELGDLADQLALDDREIGGRGL